MKMPSKYRGLSAKRSKRLQSDTSSSFSILRMPAIIILEKESKSIWPNTEMNTYPGKITSNHMVMVRVENGYQMIMLPMIGKRGGTFLLHSLTIILLSLQNLEDFMEEPIRGIIGMLVGQILLKIMIMIVAFRVIRTVFAKVDML